MSALDKLFISPIVSSQSKPLADNSKGKGQKQAKGASMTSESSDMRRLLLAAEVDVNMGRVPLLSSTAQPRTRSKRPPSSNIRPYTPGSILPIELLSSTHQERTKGHTQTNPITHQLQQVKMNSPKRKSLQPSIAGNDPLPSYKDTETKLMSQASIYTTRPYSSSSSIFSFSSQGQLRGKLGLDSLKEDDDVSINIVCEEEEVEAPACRQVAPMILSIDNIEESTPEVLELELERMTLDEILEIKRSIGGNK